MKEVKNRIKAIEAKENEETVEESEEKVSNKNKKAKKNENKNGFAGSEKFLKKKTARKESESESEKHQVVVANKDSKKPKKQEKAEEDDEEEYNFQFKKPVGNQPKNKIPNAPFKRISDQNIEKLDDDFKDNSYENYLMKSGNSYGKEANDKLRVVRGKDFRKEKTKFKNKSSAGSFAISTEIKSIKLDLDSD